MTLDVDDLIVGVPVTAGSGSTVATNGRDGYVYGVELEGAWRFHPQWTVSGFAAWQDGRTETSTFLGGPVVDEPGSRLLPLTGSLALRWTHGSEKFWVEGRVLAAAEEDRLSASDRADNQRIPSLGTPSLPTATSPSPAPFRCVAQAGQGSTHASSADGLLTADS